MSTLLTFVAKGPIIHAEQPSPVNPKWLATVNCERAKNYLRFLDHRQRKIRTLVKSLVLYGQEPLTTSFPEEPSTLLKKNLSTLPSTHRSFANELFLARTESSPLPLSQTLKNLLEPTVYPIWTTLENRLKSKSLSMQPSNTLEERCKKAISYLHPRTLTLHPQLCNENIEMPQDTPRFMLAAFEGAALYKEKLHPKNSLSPVYKTELKTTSYIIKKKPIPNPAEQPLLNELKAKELFIQEQVNNLLFATKSLNITKLSAMTENELILEYLEGGDLFYTLIDRQTPIQPQQFQQFCKTIISGLLEIERKGFCHADLKLENIFLNKELTDAKLGDLGLAHPVSERYSRGSYMYTAPEVLQNRAGTSISSDVFSFGIILFIYLFESVPEQYLCHPQKWGIDNGESAIKRIRGSDPHCHDLRTTIHRKLKDTTSSTNQRDPNELFRNLAKRCLAINPAERPSLNEIQEMLSPPIPLPEPLTMGSTLSSWLSSFLTSK